MPSGFSTSVVPMKLPGWMALTSTGVTSVTAQLGDRAIVSALPSRPFRVSVSAVIATTWPRTRSGAGAGV